MDQKPQHLFRSEASRRSRDRLHGNIGLALPLGWQIIGYGLLAGVLIAALFLSLASYGRIVTVTGSVTLTSGVASIVATRSGVVTSVLVDEQQRVARRAPLLRIRSEDEMLGGATASDEIRTSLLRQSDQIDSQVALLRTASHAGRERLLQQIQGLENEIDSLRSQIQDQHQLILRAQQDFDNAKEVAKRGFISRRDIEVREATLIGRRQGLDQMRQSVSSKTAEIETIRRSIVEMNANASAQIASSRRDQAALAERTAATETSRGYAIVSPLDGIASAVTARVGQAVEAGQQLMMVVPAGAKPKVELRVPTSAIGFVAPGQEVRLAIDAFPYDKFGSVPAVIETVSATTLPQTAKDVPPTYLVTARLRRSWIPAFGRKLSLQPGMSLTARIVTDRRNLFHWLFEPLYAIGMR